MIKARETTIETTKPLIFAIINLDPESFAGSGATLKGVNSFPCEQVILDIGPASSRPHVLPVPTLTQIKRLKTIDLMNVCTQSIVSLDTWDADVAAFGLQQGVHIINDVSGAANPKLLHEVAQAKAGYVLMYNRHEGNPSESSPALRKHPDIKHDVEVFFQERLKLLACHGISEEQIILDVGIGFGYQPGEQFDILGHIPVLRQRFNLPILVGHSRKGFLQKLIGVTSPLEADLVTSLYSFEALKQGASIIRVHNLSEAIQTATFFSAIR